MEQLALEVFSWLEEAKENILLHLKDQLKVETKSAYNDLVTNVDRKTQQFLMGKIATAYPKDKILGEEDGHDHVDSMEGRVWIIDPIDGTLNFVLQQENFCIMLALYEDGLPKLGFIYNVMEDKLYWGGKEIGVYCNQRPLPKPKDRKLNEGLLGMNAHMYAFNTDGAQEIGHATMGVRMIGCAGLEFIHILEGLEIGYLSNIQPWDYAAGCALLAAFDIPYSNLNGKALQFNGKEKFIALLPSAYQDFQENFLKK